jgi:hypothetical protein
MVDNEICCSKKANFERSRMEMTQILYISQNYSTQTLDIPFSFRTGKFTKLAFLLIPILVRDLKKYIISNELTLFTKFRSGGKNSMLGMQISNAFMSPEDKNRLCNALTDNFRLVVCNKELQDA